MVNVANNGTRGPWILSCPNVVTMTGGTHVLFVMCVHILGEALLYLIFRETRQQYLSRVLKLISRL